MSFDASSPSVVSNKPKVDKFAALAAAQQQNPNSASVTREEGEKKNVEMLMNDEPNPTMMDDVVTSSRSQQSSDSIAAVLVPLQPPRRDKFASMTAAAAVVDEGDSNNVTGRTMVYGGGGGDKFAAVLAQKQIEDKNQERQRYLEICIQRDSIWDACDTAENAIIDLLQYAEQTATILSKNTSRNIDSEGYIQSKDQLSKLVSDYQSTVIQIHDLLSKHAHHVKAYKSNEQSLGKINSSGVDNSNNSNSIYIQRVEHRLGETKRRLLHDMVLSIQEEHGLSIAPSSAEIMSISPSE